jgi:hypothetical protein
MKFLFTGFSWRLNASLNGKPAFPCYLSSLCHLYL